MAITVTIAMADGAESNTIVGQDGTQIFISVANASGSPVNLTSASVTFSPLTVSGYIGQFIIPQGGIAIPASATVILPPVSLVVFQPQMTGQGGAIVATTTVNVVGAAQVSDGSTGASSPLTITITPNLPRYP